MTINTYLEVSEILFHNLFKYSGEKGSQRHFYINTCRNYAVYFRLYMLQFWSEQIICIVSSSKNIKATYKYNYNWSLKTSKIVKRRKKKGTDANLTEQSHNFGISMLSKLAVLKPRNFMADGIPKLSFQMLRLILILFTQMLNPQQTLLKRLNQIRHENVNKHLCHLQSRIWMNTSRIISIIKAL